MSDGDTLLAVRLEASLAKFESQLKRASDSAGRSAMDIENRFSRMSRKTRSSAEQASAGVSGFFNVTARGRFLIQNTSNQIGDLFVQVGSGTSVMRAAGQQMPQLLAAFGALGAIAGTASALIFPLAAAMLDTGDAAKEAKGDLQKLGALDLGGARSALEGLLDIQQRYVVAVRDSVDARDDATRRNVANIGLEYEAQLALLDLQRVETENKLRRLQKSLDEKQREMASILADARSLAEQMYIPEVGDPNANRRRNEYIAGQIIAASDAQDELRGKIKQTGAEIAVAELALETLNEGLKRATDFGGEMPSVVDGVADGADIEAGKLSDLTAAHEDLAESLGKRRGYSQLVEDYDGDTAQLKRLLADRKEAEAILAQAVERGNDDQAAAIKRVIAAQDEQIAKAREAARETNTAYQKMAESIRNAVRDFAADRLAPYTAASGGILDLIGQAEGTDKGRGYNETLDYGAYTGGPVNLTSMTLREVLALQKQILDHPNNPHNSSAVGRYQIVAKTLRGLIRDMNLSLDEQFTPQLQDRLALQLVRGRNGQGVAGMRNEWEGLKNVPDAAINAALGQQVIPRVDSDIQKSLDEEIQDRERLQEQVERYSEKLAQSLITERERAELEKERAAAIAEIKAQGLTDVQEAEAIAQVNADLARQEAILKLVAEAKRQNVDLDSQMAGTAMTYRQAIEQIAAAEGQRVLALEQSRSGVDALANAQQFAADQQRVMEEGLVNAIMSADNFGDALKNLAIQLVQTAAQAQLMAALFGHGPLGSGGGGLLSGLSGLFGGFRAAGGGVMGGSAYVVNENTPRSEVFVPSTNGAVLTVQQAQSALRSRSPRSNSVSYSPSIVVNGDASSRTVALINRALDAERAQFFSRYKQAQQQDGMRLG